MHGVYQCQWQTVETRAVPWDSVTSADCQCGLLSSTHHSWPSPETPPETIPHASHLNQKLQTVPIRDVHSLEMKIGADSSYVVTLTLTVIRTFWTWTQQALTQCRGLLLCQVSGNSNQWFSFYHANIPTHTYIHPHTSCQSDLNIGAAVPYYVVALIISWSESLGSQPVDDISHKPGRRLPLLPTWMAVATFPETITAIWPVPNYTAWQHSIGVNNLLRFIMWQRKGNRIGILLWPKVLGKKSSPFASYTST